MKVNITRCFLLLLLMPAIGYAQQEVVSTLEVFDIETNERTQIMQEDRHFEAPNWSPDGEYFLINQNGSLYTVSMDGKKEKFNTGSADRCNNDHGFSPDGRMLAFSNNLERGPDGWLTSCIFTVPAEGGEPTRVTDSVPSFWHGWSPGSDTLVYTAMRGGRFNLFAVPATGGQEVQLTDSEGLDDGPEYAPDGKHIYYNSINSGSMEIWRMHPDGSRQEQLTDDSYSNWFPHPSPDGKHFVFISYLEDQGSDHPAMKEVALRLYNLEDGSIRTLCTLTGGQGSLNVPSWAPDGKKFAFVSYAHNSDQKATTDDH
ncbi:Tol biopolymer transport system component [Lewinella aquimaris]|uniref:Tol biopolymer transport system component n=1 Tax=Neolewinella aquimaris TaxID=1835722 RepID=A0A840E1U4_9BACT|nr:PD40 domain-containing protein [Neolewinella aquimaris]MBB4079191.1 Tol biopolymer transport system component [Neolewinella aquimaris]